MSARTTALVVERELREAVRRKAIWALVALVFLGALAIVLLPSVLPGDDGEATIALVGDDTIGLRAGLEAMPDRTIAVEISPDRDTARDAIADGDLDLAVALDDATPVLIVDDETSGLVSDVSAVVADLVVVDRLSNAGIDTDEVARAFTGAQPSVEPIDADRTARRVAAFAITLVLYLLTVILSSQVANAVAVEKANRVSEVLLAIVPPRSMLFGKVVGVGVIGLATLGAGAVPVVVKLATGGDLPAQIVPTLLATGVWFVLGLALYLIIAGSLGALVSRQEEVGAVITPLTMLLVVAYIVALSAGDSTVGAIAAYIPLFSPMIEPYRVAIGAGSAVEYTVSIVLLAASVVGVGRLGGTVYRRAVVRTGRRLRLRDVLLAPS